ncbi:MAG TPA: CoA-binding protein [Deltaproteobacteria bacterium]|nr:CoA-binding protein [Deltaproteobacteria bacterium]HOI06297.1 CoA-binding protein [Deltaproteobacteria bacterium]
MNRSQQVDVFFNPDGVAVIGASDSKGGYYLLHQILGGYKGRLFPVNPRHSSLQGVPCYKTIDDIPEAFDLAVFFIPARHLPDAIEACARKRAKGIIIESAGFAETGAAGRELQERCVALARKHGIRLWGPNCMGTLDAHRRHVFSFLYSDNWKTLLKPGNAALVVQSGMLSAIFLMMILERGGLGMSKICSIGNKCDVDETELLEYLLQDGQTGVIGMYVESITQGERFLNLSRGSAKPIVVLKGGRSPSGAQAALSHTASLAGDYAVMEKAFHQAGVVPVKDMHELMDIVRGFSKTPHLHGMAAHRGTAVLTFSGGGGIVTADMLHDHGLAPASLSEATIRALKEVFPSWMEPANPVDVWPAIETSGMEKVHTLAARALMEDEAVDSLIVHVFGLLMKSEYLEELSRLKDRLGKPVALWMAGPDDMTRPLRTAFEDMGLPVFDEMSRAVGFIAASKKRALTQRSSRPLITDK